MHKTTDVKISEGIAKVREIIKKYKSFLITSTADADGDSIGSQLALRQILKSKLSPSQVVSIINERPCPERYRFLPDSSHITTLKDNNIDRFDIGFVLDGGSERTGDIKKLYDSCRCKVIIDHHKYGSKDSYDIELRDPHISSTSEIIYNFTEDAGWGVPLNKEIASQLYLGIIFDTGFFRHSSTSPRTLVAASKLISTGIDFSDICHKGMSERNFNAQRLLGMVVESVEINSSGDVAWGVVTNKMLETTGATKEDQEGLIEQISCIKGVEVSILFKEDNEGQYKVSFRSRGKVNVAKAARLLDANGGGHERAAGCLMKGDKASVMAAVIEKVEDELSM